MAELVEAASRTGLVRFFPFKSVTMLRFATSPLWYQCEGQVAPVHIEVTSFPDRYLVCSGYFPSAELVLETGDPAAAAARAEELLVSWEPAPEDQDTLASRASLAHLTGKAGDAAGARDRFAALLPVEERVLGPEHPLTLTTRDDLAEWTGRTGDGCTSAAGARRSRHLRISGRSMVSASMASMSPECSGSSRAISHRSLHWPIASFME